MGNIQVFDREAQFLGLGLTSGEVTLGHQAGEFLAAVARHEVMGATEPLL